MKRIIQYSLRLTAWVLSAALVIILVAALLIQTKPAKEIIASAGGKQASRFLNGTLTIEKIEGNFFSRLSLKNVVLHNEKDTIAQFAMLNMHYHLWPLLRGKVVLDSVHLDRPGVFLRQKPDSTWNIEDVFPKTEQEKKPDTTQAGNFELTVGLFKISGGNIRTETLFPFIPSEINELQLALSMKLSKKEQHLLLKDFSFSSRNPDIQVNKLKFDVGRDLQNIELRNFHFETAKNQLTGTAQFDSIPPGNGYASFKTEALNMEEFDIFLPHLKIPANPVVMIDAGLTRDSASVIIEMNDSHQNIFLDARSSNLTRFLFNPSEEKLLYHLKGNFHNVHLSQWIDLPGTDHTLHGELAIEGEGLDPADAELVFSGDFNKSVIQGIAAENIHFNYQFHRGDIEGFIGGKGNFGQFHIESGIQDLMNHPVYRAEIKTRDLDLAPLTGDTTLKSGIWMTATLEGMEFSPEKVSSSIRITLSESHLYSIHVDNLLASLDYEKETFTIDSFRVQTASTNLTAEGKYSLNSPSDLKVNGHFKDLGEFSAFLPLEGLKTSGEIDARIQGIPGDLKIQSTLLAQQSEYEDYTFQELKLDVQGEITSADTSVTGKLKVHNLTAGDLSIDSMNARVGGTADSLDIDANLTGKEFQTQLETQFFPGKNMKVLLSEWKIFYKNQHWALEQVPAIFEADSVNYSLENFSLASGKGDTAQLIRAGGKLSLQGKEDFELRLENIDARKIMELFSPDPLVYGFLDAGLLVKGTADAPMITGDFAFKESAFKNHRIPGFNGSFDFSGNQFSLRTFVTLQDSGQIKLSALLPLELRLDSMDIQYNPKDSIRAGLLAEKISLDMLETLYPQGNFSGLIEGEINVGGTTENPVPKGTFQLTEGAFQMESYGINYQNILMNMSLKGEKIKLDTLRIESNDGNLTGNGIAGFASGIYNGEINQSTINLKFSKFNPLNHPRFNMQLSGGAWLEGEEDNLIFGGNLNVPQAEIYLPAILNMMGRMSTPDMPRSLLAQEAEKQGIAIDSLNIEPFEVARSDSLEPDYLNQFQGKIRLRIPKNTWIKNENMRIEISGETELIKNKEFFELFGTLSVVRGQYDLLGKTFILQEGTIRFQGGESMTPEINLTASYTFRNPERMEQTLTVNISGTAQSPEVNFKLDSDAISEGDALSYILFGKSMNELTLNEQENLSGDGGGNLAEKAAASLLSAQITGFLGDKLNVDYIEVETGQDFDRASIVVGKYITNDLFMSYEQHLGETSEKNRPKYKVTLEYELFRFLFLELNNSSTSSGFDAIIKFEAK